jgi:transposase InsO family protein
MPWKEVSTMSQREAFIRAYRQGEMSMSELCRAFGISRKTGYKWCQRFAAQGVAGLSDQSRRPHRSPCQTAPEMEQRVVALRQQHPAWGGRKLKRRLEVLGYSAVPAASTITDILRRHDLLDASQSHKHRAFQRFEMAQPNELWQMDFKGHFPLGNGQACHPLTVLDDHARFLVGLRACANQTTETVQAHLTDLFRQYGLPQRMLMDNGSPWGDRQDNPYTRLTVWLLWLEVDISHGRPYHPQTQGKDERLHRTLKAEVLALSTLDNFSHCQSAFECWRTVYNEQRPHEALDLDVPSSRYQPSPRPFPEQLPDLVYLPGDAIRKVDGKGHIAFRNRSLHIGKGFAGLPVGLRPDDLTDGVFHVYFHHTCVRQLDLRTVQ